MVLWRTPLPNSAASNFLRNAARYSLLSNVHLHKVGAIIVKNGNVISIGWNKHRTHPKTPNAFSIHAELDAILRCRTLIKSADMYVVRVTRGGSMATSMPCIDCMSFLQESGLDSVTFIDNDGKIQKRRLS